MLVQFSRGATPISNVEVTGPTAGASLLSSNYAPNCFSYTDFITAGTYTYTVQVARDSFTAATQILVSSVVLTAYEL